MLTIYQPKRKMFLLFFRKNVFLSRVALRNIYVMYKRISVVKAICYEILTNYDDIAKLPAILAVIEFSNCE